VNQNLKGLRAPCRKDSGMRRWAARKPENGGWLRGKVVHGVGLWKSLDQGRKYWRLWCLKSPVESGEHTRTVRLPSGRGLHTYLLYRFTRPKFLSYPSQEGWLRSDLRLLNFQPCLFDCSACLPACVLIYKVYTTKQTPPINPPSERWSDRFAYLFSLPPCASLFDSTPSFTPGGQSPLQTAAHTGLPLHSRWPCLRERSLPPL